MLNDLTNENKEGIYYFIKSSKDSNEIGKKQDYLFRVKVLTNKKKIIYYELSKDIRKKANDKWQENYLIIGSYKDNIEFNKLNNSFNLIYKADLNEKELFNQDITYGYACGRGGIDPKEKTQIDVFFEHNDKDSLIKWLQSTNTEKQIYAIEGLFNLNKKGIKLNEEEIKMINFVKSKKGIINVCFGCMYYRMTIQQITKQFDFK